MSSRILDLDLYSLCHSRVPMDMDQMQDTLYPTMEQSWSLFSAAEKINMQIGNVRKTLHVPEFLRSRTFHLGRLGGESGLIGLRMYHL